jgi:glutathione synthase/RimK-type ligase-like ATP-grasp enzyme
MILVVSYPDEDHTQDVIGRLRQMGRPVHLLDMADVPARRRLTMTWSGDDSPTYQLDGDGDGSGVDLGDVRVVWWRRVRPFMVDPGVTASSALHFATSETAQAVYGMLDSLDAVWINPRCADEAAHHKPWQWTVARTIGLTVPRTLVTTRPEDARRFIDEVGLGRTVFKAFLASLDAWRETRLVLQEDLDRLELVRVAPVIFQEYVDGVDLRITVMGERVFAASIDARRTRYPYDMRMVIGDAAVAPVELPPAIKQGLVNLVKKLGLRYGAIDMRRTDAGDYLFLEVNPAGQWLFVEQRTGLPISQAIADELAELDQLPGRAAAPPRRRSRAS